MPAHLKPAHGHILVDEPEIYLDGQLRADLTLGRVERWAGGQRANRAVLAYRPRLAEAFHFSPGPPGQLFGQFPTTGPAIRCEVVVKLPETSDKKIIHLGTLCAQDLEMSRQGPGYTVESMLRPDAHFGRPVDGYPVHTGDSKGFGSEINHAGLGGVSIINPIEEPPAWLKDRGFSDQVPGAMLPPKIEGFQFVPDSITFNPLADGELIGNGYQPQTTLLVPLPGKPPIPLPLPRNLTSAPTGFVDHDQTRVDGGRRIHGIAPGFRDFLLALAPDQKRANRAYGHLWTLAEAVYWICGWLNPRGNSEEDGILTNPRDMQALRYLLRTKEGKEPILRNITLPLNTYLPQALDLLLTPYGFSWYVDFHARGKFRLAFFEIGGGENFNVFYQPKGEVLKVNRRNIKEYKLSTDTSRVRNFLKLYGGKILVEFTANYIPGWDFAAQEFYEKNPLAFYLTPSTFWKGNPTLADLFRVWVLNEGGSAVGRKVRFHLPADEKPIEIKSAFDLAGWLEMDSIAVRNRKLLPCITRRKDQTPFGDHQGIVVNISQDGGQTYRQLEHHPFSILPNECGIRFDGNPFALAPFIFSIRAGLFRVKVTASIQLDERLRVSIDQRGAGLAREIQAAVIEADDRYVFRRVHPRSEFYEQVVAGELEASEADDFERLKELANEIRRSLIRADVGGSIVLSTIQIGGEELGMTLGLIEGVNRVIGSEAGGQGPPSIVGITYDYQAQETTLHLSAHRPSVAL